MQEVVFKRTQGLTSKPFHYCPGCTHGIIHRIIGEVLEELGVLEDTVGVAPVGCAAFCPDFFNVDMQASAHGRAAATATGVKRALPDKTVFTYQGDGDLAAIGTAKFIHAAVRGEKFTTIFVNNAIYGMTGGQMAPTTMINQKTSTSPFGRSAETQGYPMDVPAMLVSVPGAVYVASVSVDTPKNVIAAKKAIKKAFQIQQAGLGYSFVSVLSTCSTNWGLNPQKSLQWLRDNMMTYYQMGELKVPVEFR